ncbi:MAG: transposase [Leptolyngbya sp. SIO4C1]|nr:transposase [Leptolyngbya sp. SIO4C1]
MGIAVWCQDEAGPFQTVPYAAPSWQPEGQPQRQDHEYLRNGTAKVLTLFHPSDGQVRIKGVEQTTNAILHPWLKAELTAILKTLPEAATSASQALIQHTWQQWREGLTVTFTLPQRLPPLRLLLVWDNLRGHQTPELMVWLCEHGILPLYTPLSGSWLNMAESIQRILKRRALDAQHPKTPQQIIDRFETAAEVWNQQPTPFEWGGKRAARRQRARAKRQGHRLGGSGAVTQAVVA